MYQPAMPDTANHASTRHQVGTDGDGGEKESSVPELCSLESVCGQACVYRHIARCVFTTTLIDFFLCLKSLGNHTTFFSKRSRACPLACRTSRA